MVSEEKVEKRIVISVLDKIEELRLSSPEGNYLCYSIEKFFNNRKETLKKAEEDSAFCLLEERGAIKIDRSEIEGNNYIHYFLVIMPRFKEIRDKFKNRFIKSDSNKGDIKFGNDFIITPKGIIYENGDAELGKVGPAGFYLIRRLMNGVAVGSQDFRPKKVDANYHWRTIIKTACKINKYCAHVIQLNSDKKYYIAKQG